MSTNGNDPAEIYRRHFQSVDRYRQEAEEAGRSADRLRAEAERLAALADDWENRRTDYETRVLQAGAVAGGMRRRDMSARSKSDYLEALKAQGLTGEQAQRAYFELPW